MGRGMRVWCGEKDEGMVWGEGRGYDVRRGMRVWCRGYEGMVWVGG